MKSLIGITLFVLTFVFSGQCQNYKTLFGENITNWNVFQEFIDYGYTDSLYTTTDTLFRNNNYKKIHSIYDGLVGFLREDTTNGKAWFYSLYDNKEEIIMDFTLQLGDTFIVHKNWEFADSVSVVDSVYQTNGLRCIRLHNNAINQYYGQLTFIESIGTNFGIRYQNTNSLNQWNGFANYLLCKYNDGVQIYTNDFYLGDCNVEMTGLKTNESNRKGVLFFPNPISSENYLNVNMNDIENVTIYNSTGVKELMTTKITFPITLHSGLYYVKITNKYGEIYSDKLLVE